MTIQDLLTPERARDWHQFVADYVMIITRKRANADLVQGYTVRRVRSGYTIYWNGKDVGYAAMDASTLYGWMERLPLRYYAREADNLRAALLP